MAQWGSKLKFSREQIKEIFREHDIDGDGALNFHELTQAFSWFGSLLPFYKAHYGLGCADKDGDGYITEDELDRLVDYAMKFHSHNRPCGGKSIV